MRGWRYVNSSECNPREQSDKEDRGGKKEELRDRKEDGK